LPALTEALQDSDKFVRTLAIQAIGGLGKDAQNSVTALSKCLTDSSVEVRLAAIEELEHLGPTAKAALPALQEAQKNDRRAAVREAAGEAVKKVMGSPSK
jgi:HEAT repeat protein